MLSASGQQGYSLREVVALKIRDIIYIFEIIILFYIMSIIRNIIDYKNRGKYYLDSKYILKGGGKKYKIQLNNIEIEFKEVYDGDKRKILLNNKKYKDYSKCIVIILNEKGKT